MYLDIHHFLLRRECFYYNMILTHICLNHFSYDIFRKPKPSVEVEEFYKEREDKIRKLHEEEIKEVDKRLLVVKDRAKSDLEEYREDIEFERQQVFNVC